MRLRHFLLTAPMLILLGACGSSHTARPTPPSDTVAVVGGSIITGQQLRQSMDYALRFYSWVDQGAAQQGSAVCSASAGNPECATLRSQVLNRLIEERIVARYAASHHITLTRSDEKRVDRELARLRSPHSGTDRLFTSERVSPGLVRDVLRTQLLVSRVERAVARSVATEGPSFQVRKFVFAGDRTSYRAALDLATGGRQASNLNATRPMWVARFRMSRDERRLASYAPRGTYIGPFKHGATYVVLQILGEGTHRYGRPARDQITTAAFQSWMRKQLRSLRPECFRPNRTTAPCSTVYH